MELVELETGGFRNLTSAAHTFHAGINIVRGANGAGKTSLLEAVVVLGNLRSFRTSLLRTAVLHGDRRFHLSGKIQTPHGLRRLEQVVEVGPPLRRTLLVDGIQCRVGEYLQAFPVFAITGSDRELVGGGPEERRSIIDRFMFLLRPTFLKDLRTYRRALRQRNAALTVGARDAEMAAWEEPLAVAAARVVVGRIHGVGVLQKQFSNAHEKISGCCTSDTVLDYRGEPWLAVGMVAAEVEEKYRQRYNETRARDRLVGFTVEGPHRHDLCLRAAGRAVRHTLSSGQTKMVAAALRLAMLVQVEKERGERIPVIVDDVDSELDDQAVSRLIGILGNGRQLFISTTNKGVPVPSGSSICHIWLEDGACVRQEAENA
ncbi:MAG: DNA replication/repair protein RecF [Thermoanaerobaculales bacterium]